MKIYQLNGLDYYINESEAFGKSVFNNSSYDVTLAIATGTDLSKYIKTGDNIEGEYTVSGLTTNFESIVQDISIKREFVAGYDMYNLSISENALVVDTASALDVPNGGTGKTELSGILKGNGIAPISTAEDGTDYWSPNTLKEPVLDGDWVVNHMGGTYYQLFCKADYGTQAITTSHQGQFISQTLTKPTLPTGFQSLYYSFSPCDDPQTSGAWWIFNQPGQVRVKAGQSIPDAKVIVAVMVIAQKFN